MRFVWLSVFLILSTPLFAFQALSLGSVHDNRKVGFTIQPYTAYMVGNVHEYVFDSSQVNNHYLSKLVWDIKPAWLVGVAGSFTVQERIFLNFQFAGAVNRDTGVMNDVDWIEDYPNNYDIWSVSSLLLTENLLLDVNIAYRFLQDRPIHLEIMAGYKGFLWGWTSTVIEGYEYDSNFEAIDDYSNLVGVNGVDYSVQYHIPYIGLNLIADYKQFTSGISLSYSFAAFSNGLDNHLVTGVDYYDYPRWGQYIGLSAYHRITFSDFWGLRFSYDFDRVGEMVGDVLADNGFTQLTYENGGGSSYITSALTLGIELKF